MCKGGYRKLRNELAGKLSETTASPIAPLGELPKPDFRALRIIFGLLVTRERTLLLEN
jgi:hypothetical protein